MLTESNPLVWHGHHEVISPLEMLYETFEARMVTITTYKSIVETREQVARRLDLFKRFEGKLEDFPESIQNVCQQTANMWKLYGTGEYSYEDMKRFYNKQLRVIQEAWEFIKPMHDAQCGCGWTPENPNIFEYQDKENHAQ